MDKQKYWFFGSKLNTTLLLILIILMIIALKWMYKNKETYFPYSTENTDIKVESKEYKSTKLGLEFSYPSSWGNASENIINHDNIGPNIFEYIITFSDTKSVTLEGHSNSETIPSGEAWNAYLTEKDLQNPQWFCSVTDRREIETKNNNKGLFVLAEAAPSDIETLDCKDITVHTKKYYAVFDLNKKLKNLVVTGDSSFMSKENFIKFVNSIIVR